MVNIKNSNDLCKVLEYFRIGRHNFRLFLVTGVLRNCITWYVRDLENMGLLRLFCIAPVARTHFLAKHYSANPLKWQKQSQTQQFGESCLGVKCIQELSAEQAKFKAEINRG